MINKTLITLVENMLNNMKAGNSNIDEEGELELISVIQKITSPELTKLEAADYIGKSRATFDNYIKMGFIPEGTKRRGSSVLFWRKSDLDKYLNKKC